MSDKNQMHEVEIRSLAILREGKKSLVTYFKGGTDETIIMNCRHIYPQYMKDEDKPQVSITHITYREYERRKNGGVIKQKGVFVTNKRS